MLASRDLQIVYIASFFIRVILSSECFHISLVHFFQWQVMYTIQTVLSEDMKHLHNAQYIWLKDNHAWVKETTSILFLDRITTVLTEK